MMHYSHQRSLIPYNSHVSAARRKIPSHHDRFFHLPTTLAENDPFLRRLYSVVTLVLDDHPYPETKEAFRQRTSEIQQNVRKLKFSSAQVKFLERIMLETGVTLVDLWQGSHIITRDNGQLYKRWSKSRAANPRFSSHYSGVPVKQYGINFRDHQLLFGKTAVNGTTWFQMEAHGFNPDDIYKDPNLALYHGQDFLKYRVHRMNVGPFGFSPHTETMNPIKLSFQPVISEKQKHFLNNR